MAAQPGGLTDEFLDRLVAAETIRVEDRRVLGLFRTRRWIVADMGRWHEVKQRLDAIVRSNRPVTLEQAAFAGLVHAAGLGIVLYPGRKELAARLRLAAIAAQETGVVPVLPDRTLAPGDGARQIDTTTAGAADSAADTTDDRLAHPGAFLHNPFIRASAPGPGDLRLAARRLRT